ncbi:cupredoxin domain-containing protein [Sulfuricella sp.]|uniref:cupredoxin domain-containing protein n=1 Tax=Sulfuricella sp. TaxID=2099377 RepID=UPI002B62CA23|nr:cupredoxin domain-containing protein [Sulfuricella sp.]HUX63018.1 cupredoxin domain-containing protein [Sulfuricella sp.]
MNPVNFVSNLFRKMSHVVLGAMTVYCANVAVASDSDYMLVIKDHRFQPAELTVPAGKKIKLFVENRDATPEEFESHDLNREKVIAGLSTATIFVGPLAAGRYRFFGEFNEKTAQGVIVVQ